MRRRRNKITALETDSGRVEEPDLVKVVASNHFKNTFTDQGGTRPSLDGIDFNCLSEVESTKLEEVFSREKIKEVIWECDGDKSPGPDGYNITFLKKCWDILGEDVIGAIQEFHTTVHLPKVVIASFLALIPKSLNP
ncbi:unnamed protein product [Lathyrus sativus]|nr:unnamed protein product [Lathyrus sativus]